MAIVRFEIKTPAFTPNVNPSICGITTVHVTSGLNILIELDDVPIVVPTPNVNNVYRLDIPFTQIWHSKKLRIRVAHDDYMTYDNTFTIYGYDLGNDPIAGINRNPDFVFYLIQPYYDNSLVGGDPEQRLAYADFIVYRRPLTNQVYYYVNHSSLGELRYYRGAFITLTGGRNGFLCCQSELVMQQQVVIMDRRECCGDFYVVDECLSLVKTIEEFVFMPDQYVSVTTNSCDNEAVNVLTVNKSSLHLNLSNVQCYWVDDDKVSPYDTIDIVQKLYAFASTVTDNKINGIKMDETDTSFTIEHSGGPTVECNIQVNPPTSLPFEWEFETPEEGDYVIETEMIVPDSTLEEEYALKIIKRTPITSCYWYELTDTEQCNKYRIYNRSFDDIDIKIYKLADNMTFDLVHEDTILKCNIGEISISIDGVYKVEATKTVDDIVYTEISVIISYCNLDECRRQYLHNIMCCNPKDSCNVEDVYKFNALSIQVEAYFSMINAEYNFGYRYNALDSDKINQLYVMSQFMDRFIGEYCDECNIPTDCNHVVFTSNCGSCS